MAFQRGYGLLDVKVRARGSRPSRLLGVAGEVGFGLQKISIDQSGKEHAHVQHVCGHQAGGLQPLWDWRNGEPIGLIALEQLREIRIGELVGLLLHAVGDVVGPFFSPACARQLAKARMMSGHGQRRNQTQRSQPARQQNGPGRPVVARSPCLLLQVLLKPLGILAQIVQQSGSPGLLSSPKCRSELRSAFGHASEMEGKRFRYSGSFVVLAVGEIGRPLGLIPGHCMSLHRGFVGADSAARPASARGEKPAVFVPPPRVSAGALRSSAGAP